MKICPICNREWPDEFLACPMDGGSLVAGEPECKGVNIALGDASAVSGGIHTNTDSHNVHNESHITHTVNNVAAQKTEMEILQEKKAIYLAECKRAYEDNILDPSEVMALEECRLKLGLDEVTAKEILESVRLLADRNARRTSLNPIARVKLKILSKNLQDNNVPALKEQIGPLEALVNKFEHDELSFKYFLALAVLDPRKCIEQKENSPVDSYWKSYWSCLAYIREGQRSVAEALLADMDRFADYPEDNVAILAIAGALLQGNEVEAREYLNTVTGEYTPELQRLVDSLYLLLDPEAAVQIGAEESACAFYLENLFGWKDPKVKVAERKANATPVECKKGSQNEHDYVDLGLSVKWATCNVGASKPEDCGDYFAWGETEPKSDYSWSTYKYSNISDLTMTKYCTEKSYGYKSFSDNKTVLDLEDDAAHVNWGGNWRIPTFEEQDELSNTDNCTWTWYDEGNTEFNGIAGYKVQSKKAGFTDKWIFLPAAGYRNVSDLDFVGSSGRYWSSSLYSDFPYCACSLYFSSGDVEWYDYNDRFVGRSVRPVCP